MKQKKTIFIWSLFCMALYLCLLAVVSLSPIAGKNTEFGTPAMLGNLFFGGCQLWNSHDFIWPGNFGYEVFFGCGTGVLEYSAAISDSVWTDGQYLFSRNKGTGKSGLAFECFPVCPVSDGEYPLVYFLPSKKRRVKKISSLFLPNLL